MSHARRARRVLAALACTAAAASAGCRSPFHSFADVARPDAPEVVAAIDREETPAPAPSVAIAPPVEEPIEPVATPMLDAALRRAKAAEEAQRQAVREAELAATIPLPTRAVEPEPEPAPALMVIETPPPDTDTDEPAPAPAAKVDPDLSPASTQAAADDDGDEGPEGDTPAPVAIATAEPEPAAPTPPAPVARPEPLPEAPGDIELPEVSPTIINKEGDDGGLAIDAADLCRKITDFGSYEPLKDRTLHPGRSALIYCELSGLEYRPEGDEFVARVATRVELIRPDDGARAWEVADSAVDRRPARRRDVYVGTMITLPDSIAPGEYTLRLYQADAATGRTASTDLPVAVAR